MTGKLQNKRWWLWVPLLAGAAYLAIFGDKSPNGALSTSVQSPSSLSVPPDTGRLDISGSTDSRRASAQKIDPTSSMISTASRVRTALLDPVIPREQLILKTPTKTAKNRDLFASGGWNPPVPVSKPLPPPLPTAPALPFTFLGKKLEGGTWEVFLARGEQSFVVRAGSLIENTYRVDAIAPPSLGLTYLPLAERQTLSIGDSQ